MEWKHRSLNYGNCTISNIVSCSAFRHCSRLIGLGGQTAEMHRCRSEVFSPESRVNTRWTRSKREDNSHVDEQLAREISCRFFLFLCLDIFQWFGVGNICSSHYTPARGEIIGILRPCSPSFVLTYSNHHRIHPVFVDSTVNRTVHF